MLNKYRTAFSAFVAIGLAASLLGSIASPAAAASQVISQHGAWKAMLFDDDDGAVGQMVADYMPDGGILFISRHADGSFDLCLTHPSQQQVQGTVPITATVDGRTFKGTAVPDGKFLRVRGLSQEFGRAFYGATEVEIKTPGGSFELSGRTLDDARAAMDDLQRYGQRRVSR